MVIVRKIKKILNIFETKKEGFTEVVVKTLKPFKSEIKVYVKDNKIHTSPNLNGSEFTLHGEGLLYSIKDALFPIISESLIEHNKVYGTLKRTSDITDGQLLELEDDPERMIGKTVKIVATDDNFPSDIIITHPTIKGQYVVDLDDVEYTDEDGKIFKQAVLFWDIELDQGTPSDEFEVPVEFEEELK